MTDQPRTNKTCAHFDDYSLSKLKILCQTFDSKTGGWPEHELEGYALYQFALNPDKDPEREWHTADNDWWEECKKLNPIEYKEKEPEPPRIPKFVFPVDNEDELLRTVFNHHAFKKSEFFKEESPDWLADYFIIEAVNQTSGVLGLKGTGVITPLDVLYEVDEKTMTVIENKTKHENVKLTIYY
jgi:hypothetical protein